MEKSINTIIPDVYEVMKSKDYSGDLDTIAMQCGREVEQAIKNAFEPYEQKKDLRMTIGSLYMRLPEMKPVIRKM